MRYKKNLIIFLLILIVFLPFIQAFDSKMTIKADSGSIVDLRIQNSKTGKTYSDGAFLQLSPDKNQEVFVSYSCPQLEVKLSLISEKNGLQKEFNGAPILFFNDVEMGKDIYIDLTKSEPSLEYIEKIVNETPEGNNNVNVALEVNESAETKDQGAQEPVEETIKTQETEQTSPKSPLTGLAVLNENPVLKNTIYIIGIIFIVSILIFISTLVVKKGIKNKESKVKVKWSEEDEEKELRDAEEKIKEAAEKINKIEAKRSRLKEAEEKLKKDRDEYENLRKGLDLE